jgi:hypothetical protein
MKFYGLVVGFFDKNKWNYNQLKGCKLLNILKRGC